MLKFHLKGNLLYRDKWRVFSISQLAAMCCDLLSWACIRTHMLLSHFLSAVSHNTIIPNQILSHLLNDHIDVGLFFIAELSRYRKIHTSQIFFFISPVKHICTRYQWWCKVVWSVNIFRAHFMKKSVEIHMHSMKNNDAEYCFSHTRLFPFKRARCF